MDSNGFYRPPDHALKPEATEEASNEQTTEETAESPTLVEDSQNTSAETIEGAAENESAPQAGEVEAEQAVSMKSDLPGHDAPGALTVDAAVPRLDSLYVRSAFQQLKTTDEEIQAGIVEAVVRQLEIDEATAAREVEAGAVGSSVQDIPEAAVQDAVEAEANQPEVEAVGEPEAVDLQPEAENPPSAQEAIANETLQTPITTPTSEEIATPTAAVSATDTSPTVAPDNATPKAAPPGLGMFANASPEELASLMAYLQQLQGQKAAVPTQPAAPQMATSEAPRVQEDVSNSATEKAVPESPSTEAIASMTEPVDPSGPKPEAPQSIETILPETTVSDSVNFEDMEPEPSTSDQISSYAAMLDAVTADFAAAGRKPDSAKSEPEDVQISQSEASSAIGSSQETPAEKAEGKANDVESTLDEELERKLAAAEKEDGALSPKLKAKKKQPLRMPRNVQAFYLQPLRRVAKYGVPSCDLQLRSYSIRPLESFCDFALRAAYYLGLPAYGPTPLPKIIERWTVPRSSFIFKKSQENFERITRRRLIQIKDGHPETVQIWLAFLQKHQQAAVGMKANLWEFSSLGKSTITAFANDRYSNANDAIDVAKELSEALEKAEPLIKDKFSLLAQKKEFATVEKVDEFLQSERYRLTGGQFTGEV